MPTPARHWVTVTSVADLHIGDIIEARRLGSSCVHHGEVDALAPRQGVLWILSGPFNQRMLLDVSEYVLSKLPPAAVASLRSEGRLAPTMSSSR